MISLKSVAILGGTGDLGKGLAVRLAGRYEVTVGSRDASRARGAAEELSSLSGKQISGRTNDEAAELSECAILAIPSLPASEAMAGLRDALRGKLVVSPIVPMKFDEGVFSYSLREGSAAETVASALDSRVVAALHTVPAGRLLRPGEALDYDIPVTADGPEDFTEAAELISSIERLRPLYAGPLKNSRLVESVTPLLLNLSRFAKLRSPSFRVVQ